MFLVMAKTSPLQPEVASAALTEWLVADGSVDG